MAINNDYLDSLADFSDRFTRAGLSGFRVYERTLGTEVRVVKHKKSVNQESDRYNKLLKGAMNLDDSGAKQSTEVFTTRLLLNRSQMGAKYQKSTEETQVTYTKDIFSIGDIISYDYLRVHYTFKVTQIESFGQLDNVLFRMTLQPHRESK